MRDADTAMYQAKRAGKARHEVFDENMHAEARETLRLETDLRRADALRNRALDRLGQIAQILDRFLERDGRFGLRARGRRGACIGASLRRGLNRLRRGVLARRRHRIQIHQPPTRSSRRAGLSGQAVVGSGRRIV